LQGKKKLFAQKKSMVHEETSMGQEHGRDGQKLYARGFCAGKGKAEQRIAIILTREANLQNTGWQGEGVTESRAHSTKGVHSCLGTPAGLGVEWMRTKDADGGGKVRGRCP